MIQVNKSLMELIRATQSKLEPQKWTNLTVDDNGTCALLLIIRLVIIILNWGKNKYLI
jgi:hypothetical protein